MSLNTALEIRKDVILENNELSKFINFFFDYHMVILEKNILTFY